METEPLKTRLWTVWRKGAVLAAPVIGEKVLRTLMRTTDIFVAGLFSPAAIAAVGLGDVFGNIVNRTGNGLGGATIALLSQDTGSEAYENRNEAITQAVALGCIVGVPFAVFGALFNSAAIAIMGAEPEVVRRGGQYLVIILISAPAIIVTRISVRAIQGIGDTRTPMYIRGFTNVLNMVGTVVLAFGLGPFPRLAVVGIALATAIGETVTAVLLLVVIYGPLNDLHFTRPTSWVVTEQLVSISLPKAAEGGALVIADIPFNAVLLAIGTEANAAYHIGKRVYRQILTPMRSGFSVAGNILVGQWLGRDIDVAYFNGVAITALSVLATAGVSFVLYFSAAPLVRVFTRSPPTVDLSIGFVQVFSVAGVLHAVFSGLAGSLRGGSGTRTPFLALLVGMFVFLLGTSYVGGIYLEYGVSAVYVAILLDYGWRSGFLGVVYHRRNWIEYGVTMMEDRGSLATTADEVDN